MTTTPTTSPTRPERMYLLPESVALALIQYLTTKPFGEVEQGITALRQLTPADGSPPPLVPESPVSEDVPE